jgi:rhodanese-related sulfurtransferase
MEIVSSRLLSSAPGWRLVLITTGLIMLVTGFGMGNARGIQWSWLKGSLRTRFPHVRWITTQEVADQLAAGQGRTPMLLDVRTTAEWSVSHLPGARRVEPKSSPDAALRGVAKDAPIVTYCAVGYRSGEMAERLRQAGYTNVQNLEGSIFQWANEHRPLVHDGKPVKQVHPYNAFWGRLLSDDVRAPLPPE